MIKQGRESLLVCTELNTRCTNTFILYRNKEVELYKIIWLESCCIMFWHWLISCSPMSISGFSTILSIIRWFYQLSGAFLQTMQVIHDWEFSGYKHERLHEMYGRDMKCVWIWADETVLIKWSNNGCWYRW